MASQLAEALEIQDSITALERVLREWDSEFDGNWSTVATVSDQPATFSGGQKPLSYRQFTALKDRSDGKFWPYYETEQDLAVMRSKARMLGTFTSVSLGAMQALNCYVMQGEWEYEAVAREDRQEDPAPELLREVNRILRANLERNAFIGDMDGEIHDFSREDGDVVIAGYAAADGTTDLRRLSADMLREPSKPAGLNDWLELDGDKREPSWSFGCLTRFDRRQGRIDHERIEALHVVFDDGGRDFDVLPVAPQAHMGDADLCHKFGHLIKTPGTPRFAKRGVTDYFPIQGDIERGSKLSTNLGVATAIQAAVPWIEKMPPGTTKAQITEGLANRLNEASNLFAGRRASQLDPTKSRKGVPAGTVPVIPNGRDYVAPPALAGRSNIIMDVAAYILRLIGLRWLFPEYMITGDASNANFASTLVAESPFVKRREAEQRFYVPHFRQIWMKCLKIACDAGRFARYGVQDFGHLASLIEIKITPPPVATRDKAQLLNEVTSAYDRGIIDANEFRVGLKMEPDPKLEGVRKPQFDPLAAALGGTGFPAGNQPGANPGPSGGPEGGGSGPENKPQPKPTPPGSAGGKPPQDPETARREAMTMGILLGRNIAEARAAANAALTREEREPNDGPPATPEKCGDCKEGEPCEKCKKRPSGHVKEGGTDCGANATGGGGFQPGNDCAGDGDGGNSGDVASGKTKQTESPEFKAWFGDSKVVDSNGKPRVVYHGTTATFDAFDGEQQGSNIDYGKLGAGHYFTEDANLAGSYAMLSRARKDGAEQIKPVYLAISNPLEIPAGKTDRGANLWDKLRSYSRELGISEDPVIDREANTPNREWAPKFTQALKRLGHDGVVVDFGDGKREWVAFGANQIKSATGNSGKFDPNSDDIRESKGV